MQKGSNRKLKIFLAVVIGVFVLFGGIFAVTMLGTANGWFASNLVYTSGTFVNSAANYHNSGFTYAAQRANGLARIHADLSREDLDGFTIGSSIGNGEMSVIISQGDISRTVDLSNGSMEFSSTDIDTSVYSPGRLRIELKFNNAEDLDIEIKWG